MKNGTPEISCPSTSAAILPENIQPPLGTGVMLDAWMDAQAGAICRGEWSGWPCAGGFDVMSDALIAAEADQGALWLVDDQKHELRPCFSIGEHSEFFLREIRQPLSSGLISMVFFTEDSICEAEVGRRSEYCPDVDSRLGAKTQAMIAIPVFFAQRCRGVFSAVLFEASFKTKHKEAFLHSDFEKLSQACTIWSELIDSQLAGVAMQVGSTAAS
jgi:hypothetical protein